MADAHAAVVRLAAAEQRLDQGRLAGAVRPDERDVLAALERERRVVEQLALADPEGDALRLDDGSSAARRIDEAEAEPLRSAREQRDLLADLRLLLRQAADLRQLRLGLLRLRLLVAEARDEALEPRDVLGVARRLLRRGLQARRLLEPPLVPRAGEVRRAAGLELEHGGRRRLEEPAVVRDEDDARVERRQLVLEPFEARHVEVVRRLVEEQQVGVAAERARERRARQLAAGERVERAVEIGLREAEAARDGADALAPGVAAGVLEPRLRLGIAASVCGPWSPRRHRLLEAPQLLLDRDEVGGAREDVLAQREAALQRRTLVVQCDARALRERELAAVDLGLAGEHAQQRRLAGAVRPGERDAVAALDLEGHAVEEEVAGELLAEVGCDDDGHRED